ncbi:uncharacterized protein LOC131860152 [Cryptomeria japonica]|uniref:uncharacterized protein LOC131860152 n=1 Tax=Cryptomeria japonica TaxID=3369 RepID=UPI0027DA95D3|nr:uncharacterized protein LOC131860152 [Cryptomeria japonica]
MQRKLAGWKGCFKLNFDGAARQGLAVGGSVIKTHNGSLVATYMRNLNGHSSNQAEAMDLAWVVHFTLSMGIRAMDIEGDSKLIIDAVTTQDKLNKLIEGIARDIIRLILGLDSFCIMHIYKEGNGVVNVLATLGLMDSSLKC